MSRSWPGHLAIIMFVVAVALGVGAARVESMLRFGPGPLIESVTIVVGRHQPTQIIARQLQAAGVVPRWWLFELALQVFDRGGPIQAGEYEFTPAESLQAVLEQMRAGRTVVHHLTIPEGLSVTEIVALIRAEPALSGQIDSIPAEGSLMPETYNFSLSDSRPEMVARMRRAMERILNEAWETRAPGLSYESPEAALALASIVEKETAVPEERPKVAAVFLNRLSRGMRLQSDPTVIYALTGGKTSLGRPLEHADLSVDSPFNLYRHDGLPPTPIACPGRSALHAVLHPDENDLLYFVADGTGHHIFAATLDDHNRNVSRLRQIEGKLPSSGTSSN